MRREAKRLLSSLRVRAEKKRKEEEKTFSNESRQTTA